MNLGIKINWSKPHTKKEKSDYHKKYYQIPSITLDGLIEILKEKNEITKEELKILAYSKGFTLYGVLSRGKKIGIIEIEGNIIKLIKSPMLYAFNGFYKEKEK